MTFDITESLAPDSQQLDAIELVAGARIFVIERVSEGPADQPVQVHLRDFPRPWRPGKSMRRVLAAAWGTDASVWPGRSVELFCDPDVRFGKDKVGGTRIKRLSHIAGPVSVPLLVSRGKSATYVVQPLPDSANAPVPSPAETPDLLNMTLDELTAAWKSASAEDRPAIEARAAEVKAANE